MKRKNLALRAFLLILAVLTILGSISACKQERSPGEKEITVTVVHGDKSEREFTINTEAETLREALEEQNLIAGEESEFGLFVQTVDGETANPENEEWWCITNGGETHNYGVDDTNIADGERYEFTFTVGY